MAIELYLQADICSPDLTANTAYLNKVIATTLDYIKDTQNDVLVNMGLSSDHLSDVELSIIITDEATSQHLNYQYRQKNKPTNVLSFVSDVPDEIIDQLPTYPLGDLIICLPLVLQEANNQQKTPLAHFSHLVVHGVLHLLGYDHETSDADADAMENLEIAILAKLNIANPYDDKSKTYS